MMGVYMRIPKSIAEIIKRNSVALEVTCNLPGLLQNPLYGFVVSRMEGDRYRVLVSKEFYAYTRDQAQADGEEFIREVKAFDLSTVR